MTSLPCIQDLMTKSISAILQESLCSEVNFSEEAEYESAMVANLQVDVNIQLIICNNFQIVCELFLKPGCIPLCQINHIFISMICHFNEFFAYTRTINNFFSNFLLSSFNTTIFQYNILKNCVTIHEH